MAYISTEGVAAIRNELKREFADTLRFKVQKHDNSKVDVTITKGIFDFSFYLDDRGKNRLSLRWAHYNEPRAAREVIDKIVEIIKNAPARAGTDDPWFDLSDSMTDYQHQAYYFGLRVGDRDAPYEHVPSLGRSKSAKAIEAVRNGDRVATLELKSGEDKKGKSLTR